MFVCLHVFAIIKITKIYNNIKKFTILLSSLKYNC